MKPIHPPYTPRLCGSYLLISCIAITFGAPLSVPAGKVSMNVLTASAPALLFRSHGLRGVSRGCNIVAPYRNPLSHRGSSAAQVVSCQIHQHDVYCILLWVGKQGFGCLTVGLLATCPFGGSCYRVDACDAVLNLAVCFR